MASCRIFNTRVSGYFAVEEFLEMRPYLRLALFLVLFSSLAKAQAPDKAAKIDQLARQYADCCGFTGSVLDHLKELEKPWCPPFCTTNCLRCIQPLVGGTHARES